MNNAHILLFVIIFALCVGYCNLYNQISQLKDTQTEHYTALSNESLQNLASLYNNGTLTVNSIKVTGDAEIGKWTIKGDAIGIPGVADINLNKDGWVRLVKYGSPSTNLQYSGGPGSGGFAAYNLWASVGDSNVYMNNLIANTANTKTINNSGVITTTDMTVNSSIGNIKNANSDLFPNSMIFNSYEKGKNTPGALCLRGSDGTIKCLTMGGGTNNCGSLASALVADGRSC